MPRVGICSARALGRAGLDHVDTPLGIDLHHRPQGLLAAHACVPFRQARVGHHAVFKVGGDVDTGRHHVRPRQGAGTDHFPQANVLKSGHAGTAHGGNSGGQCALHCCRIVQVRMDVDQPGHQVMVFAGDGLVVVGYALALQHALDLAVAQQQGTVLQDDILDAVEHAAIQQGQSPCLGCEGRGGRQQKAIQQEREGLASHRQIRRVEGFAAHCGSPEGA